MTESLIMLSQMHILEADLESFCRRKSVYDRSHRNIDVLASFLYSCETKPGNVFLFNYGEECLFTAYWEDFPDQEGGKKYILTVNHLAQYAVEQPFLFVTTNSGHLQEVYRLRAPGMPESVPDGKNLAMMTHEAALLTEKFWHFSQDRVFPAPEVALRKRNYFYEPLKRSYRRYRKRMQEQEKPARIRAATAESPFHYDFDQRFLTFEGRVLYNDSVTGDVLELPGADPFSFGLKGFPMDENHYYEYRLRVMRDEGGEHLSGSRSGRVTACFQVHPSIDPQSFTHVKKRVEPVYLKDSSLVYVRKKRPLEGTPYFNQCIMAVPGADPESFSYLGFHYGRDGRQLYVLDTPLPVDPGDFQLDLATGFLWDRRHVFHYDVRLSLDGASFSVVSSESEVNPFLGPFVLQDKTGRYRYDRDGKKLVRLTAAS